MSKSRLISGKIKKVSGAELSTERYEYLDLSNAEPDLGLPTVDQSVLIGDTDGTRTWVDLATYAEDFRGFSGFSGIDGTSGIDGADGADGASGFSGTSGFSGQDGIIGVDGATGATGISGFSGIDGVNGFSGFSGIDGVSGFSGFSGFSGIDGLSGFSGIDGVQGALQQWTLVSSNVTASDGDRLIVDTSTGSFNITLPATPAIGEYVQITDGANLVANSVTVLRNGSTVENQEINVILDLQNITYEFIYGPDTWQVTATTGAQGATGAQGFSGVDGFSGSDGVSGFSGFSGFSGSQPSRFINLTVSGDISQRTGQFRFYSPIALTITKIYASISVQAQGGAFTFALNKNGVNTGAVLSIPEGSFIMSVVNVSIAISSTDYLTLDVTGVNSRDLHVKLEYQSES